MISIIRAPSSEEESQLLRELFAKRYELFVEGRGWRSLARPDRLDIDQYDDGETTYVIKTIEGAIVGGARLRSTLLPHMLKDTFGALCDGGCPPVGPTIFECSRTFVARRHPERRAIFAEVLLEVAQYCLDRGIDRLTGVLETWWLNSYLRLGLVAKPLGAPQDVDEMLLLPVCFEIDARVCETLRTALKAMNSRKLALKAA